MNNVVVSIIIPVFNLENYLKKCLDSVIRQSFREIEIICINDASTDNSLSILEEYQRNDSRIRLYNVSKMGQGLARNMGIEYARGNYVGFVDGDDSIHPDMFYELYNAAIKNDSEIALCHALTFDATGKKVKYPYYDNERKHFKSAQLTTTFNREEIIDKLSVMTVVSWNKIYKKAFLNKWNIRFCGGIIHEDIPFFYQAVLHATRLELVRKQLYYYTANRPGSTTNAVMSLSPRVIDVLRLTQEKIQEHFTNKKAEEQFMIFKTLQLLSFINYSLHRHQLAKFTKLRFFLMTSNELNLISPQLLASLSIMDKLQVKLIRRKYYKSLRIKTLFDALLFHTRSIKGFLKLITYFTKMFFYHLRYYVHRFYSFVKKHFINLTYKFKL